PKAFRKCSTCYRFLFYFGLMLFQVANAFAVPAQSARGEEAVVAGSHQIWAAGGECRDRNESGLGADFISAKETQPIQFVCGYETFNFIEERQWIEWAQFGLEAIRDKPHGMAVRLAGLRSARLA